MIAYTNEPREKVKTKSRKVGFDLIMGSISVADIIENLIPLLEQRRDQFNKLV